MKTQLLTILIATLSLSTINSYAESTEKAEALPDKVEVAELSTELNSMAVENNLEIEDWMFNDEYWNMETNIAEEELSIEDWMTDDEYWKIDDVEKEYKVGNMSYKVVKIQTEKTEELAIEKWMYNDNFWRL